MMLIMLLLARPHHLHRECFGPQVRRFAKSGVRYFPITIYTACFMTGIVVISMFFFRKNPHYLWDMAGCHSRLSWHVPGGFFSGLFTAVETEAVSHSSSNSQSVLPRPAKDGQVGGRRLGAVIS